MPETPQTPARTAASTPLSRRALLQNTLSLAAASPVVLLPATLSPAALAQQGGIAPVPFYTPAHVVQAVYTYWLLPRSQHFAQAAQTLHNSLTHTGNGSRQQQQQAWTAAMSAWEQLSTVAIGPLLQHRSIRSVDFTPTRPRLIRRALASAPQTMGDMELVGAPARGLPALEWLLWQYPEKAEKSKPQAASAYSLLLSEDILQHARQLEKTTQQMAAMQWRGEAAKAAFSELINQWLGAMERLRWSKLQKPLMQKAQGSRKAQYPREFSRQSSASWLRQWQAIYQMAGFDAIPDASVPALKNDMPSGLITLESYLRGLGDNPLANRLANRLQQCNTAMQALAPLQPLLSAEAAPAAVVTTAVEQAAKQLETLQRLTEHQLATAMRVSIGFSDADGD